MSLNQIRINSKDNCLDLVFCYWTTLRLFLRERKDCDRHLNCSQILVSMSHTLMWGVYHVQSYIIWNVKTQIKIIKLSGHYLCVMLLLIWTCDYIYSYLLHNTRAHGVVFFFHHIQFSNPFYLFSLLLMIDKIKHVSRGNWMIFRLTIDFVHLNYQINRNITWWWVDLCVNTLRRITLRQVGNKS